MQNELDVFLDELREAQKDVEEAEDKILRAYYRKALAFKKAGASGVFNEILTAEYLKMGDVYLMKLKFINSAGPIFDS